MTAVILPWTKGTGVSKKENYHGTYLDFNRRCAYWFDCWSANIAAGLVGSSVGQALLGSWGPSLAGMSLIPSVIGAVIVVMITSFVLSKTNN